MKRTLFGLVALAGIGFAVAWIIPGSRRQINMVWDEFVAEFSADEARIRQALLPTDEAVEAAQARSGKSELSA